MQNDKSRRCPVCNRVYDEYPALSRKDNKTEICPQCGINEAMAMWGEQHRYIFEQRYCQYANKQGNCFKCDAPSDEAMTCK